MKKKILALLSITVSLFTFIGCAKEEETKVLNMEEVYQSIIDLQANTGMEALIMFPESNADYLEMLYPGFSSIEQLQTVAYLAPVTGFATEIILVEVANKEDVAAMEDIFETRIEKSASDTTYPETAIHWANHGQVHTYGNYICMIVLPEGYTIPQNVFELD